MCIYVLLDFGSRTAIMFSKGLETQERTTGRTTSSVSAFLCKTERMGPGLESTPPFPTAPLYL